MNLYIKDIPINHFMKYINDSMLDTGNPLQLHFDEFDNIKSVYYTDIQNIESKDTNEFMRNLLLDSIDEKWKNSKNNDLNSTYVRYLGLMNHLNTLYTNKKTSDYIYDTRYLSTSIDTILVKDDSDLKDINFIETLNSKINNFIANPNWRISTILDELNKSPYKKILDYENNFNDEEIYRNVLKEEFREYIDSNETDEITILSNKNNKRKPYESINYYDLKEFFISSTESRVYDDNLAVDKEDIESIANKTQEKLLIDSYFNNSDISEDNYSIFLNPDTLFDFLSIDPEDGTDTILKEWRFSKW
jgi:hypothetical protein